MSSLPFTSPFASISRRLLVQVLTISVVVACVAASWQLHAAYRAGLQAVQDSLRLIEATQLPSLTASVWQLDEGLISHQLAGIARQPDVSHVRLEGELPFPVPPLGQPHAAASGGWLAPVIAHTYPLVHADAASGAPPQVVARLHVEVSLGGLYHRVGNMALGIVATELIRTVALALALLIGVRRLVLRPLQQVVSYSSELTLDRLHQPLLLQRPPQPGPDEIDVLADAINGMRLSLDDQIARRQATETRSQQLAVEKEAAELASAAKGEFLANVSHEIRTPMNAIIGMTDLALHSGLPEPQRGYVMRVKTAANLLLGILNDILDFSKIEAGKLDIERVSFDLDDVVQSVSDLLGGKAREKGLTLLTQVDADVPQRLAGDPLRLQQVLVNLLGNALKFTPRGEVRLHIGLLGQEGAAARLRLTVRDTGVGMSADQMSRLFQPFTQADTSTSRRFGGTGLGLAISRQLVERMGGRIDVASEPGQGSTFWVELPFELERPPGVAPPHAPMPPDELAVGRFFGASGPLRTPGADDHPELAGLRVLLVEDNEVNQELAVALLERVGISVTVAGNGRQAWEALQASEGDGAFDCVLMDCQMPEMDGYTATRLIRQEPRWSRLPIVAMTANAMTGEREKVVAAGMNDHVPKPIPVGELYRKLGLWSGRVALAAAAR
ncbi:MAG: response regulator [Burkholderiales bacterium]|nr:response regulator [Burkholderiales bacterium]MBH2017922.1 response regulator [Burkholderiales bacterium]